MKTKDIRVVKKSKVFRSIILNFIVWISITFISTFFIKLVDYLMKNGFKNISFKALGQFIFTYETLITFTFSLGIYTCIITVINSELRKNRAIIKNINTGNHAKKISLENNCEIYFELAEPKHELLNIDINIRCDSKFMPSFINHCIPLVYDGKRTYNNASALKKNQFNLLIIEIIFLIIMMILYIISKGDYKSIEVISNVIIFLNLMLCCFLYFTLEGFKC